MSTVPASDNGAFLWLVHRAMSEAGLDCGAIFASVGMPDAPPDRERRRINAPQKVFWETAERVSGDADIGLHIGERMAPFRGQVMEYLCLSSPTLGDGLERLLRYNRLFTDALQFQLRREGGYAVLSGLEHPVRHYLECAACVALRFLCLVTDGEFRAAGIRFPHEHGAAPEEYRRVYGAQVTLGAGEGAIVFDTALLERPSPAAEPELMAVHDRIARERLADLARGDFRWLAEREIGSLLERGEISLEALAARLDTSPRALRAGLAATGTSFRGLVAGYRERLARGLLARTAEPLDQIIYLTGFSEPAAFSHAFKRWTGETPTAYRKRKQGSREVS